MRLNRLARTLAASTLLAASSAAFAVPTTVTNLGELVATGSQFERAWARWFGAGSQTGPFKDSYTFSLATAANTIGTIVTFEFGNLDLTLGSVSLSKNGSAIDAVAGSSSSSFTFEALQPGSYMLDVAGTLNLMPSMVDVGGAYYQGKLTLASPAPEPAAIAMGLAGLLAVGSVVGARRRRKD